MIPSPPLAQIGRAAIASLHLGTDMNLNAVKQAHAAISDVLHDANMHQHTSSSSSSSQLRLYTFGSTATFGVHTPGSDVDVVVLTSHDIHDGRGADADNEVARGLQSRVLRNINDALRRRHVCWQTEMVSRARVPVLRVHPEGDTNNNNSNNTNNNNNNNGARAPLTMDITAHRRNGVRNSALLRSYFEQCPDARLLAMLVKRWSKSCGINSSCVGGFMTSYGLNLMIAYYLLQRQRVVFVPPTSMDVSSIAQVPPHWPLRVPEDDGRQLAELLNDFLRYYLHEFMSEKEVISISRAQPTRRDDLGWQRHVGEGRGTNYLWCIEDPYEMNLNVARHVSALKRMLLLRHLQKAAETYCGLTEWMEATT